MLYTQSAREQTLTVSDVNKYVKALMDNDALLSSISVTGEISNLKYHTSGHLYFTLKDAEAEIAAVMFRSSVNSMRFAAKNGMQVTAYGRVSVYEKSGKCQLYVTAMVDNGVGNLQLEYERLFRKLSEEGLFLDSRKKPLPRIPQCIGIITSPTGAAVRDMINVTGRRWPLAKILLYPSLVQGSEAPESLCRGLEYLNADRACDVIIIGRGGGSIEDLWAFNDERVVRAIAASEIPVISAVGHETDFTLSDFVADKRAPTPSAAAEIAVPDRGEMRMRLDDAFGRSESAFLRCINEKKNRISALARQIELCSPITRLENEKRMLEHKKQLMNRAVTELLRKRTDRLRSAVGRLEAINPLAVLSRGYNLSKREDGSIVSAASALKVGESISLVYADGEAKATVTETAIRSKKRTKRATRKENSHEQ